MAQPSYLLGRRATAYYNIDGSLIGDITPQSGTTLYDYTFAWLTVAGEKTVEATNLTSTNYDIGSDFADATTRETAKEGFASNVPVLKNGQVTFDIRWLPLDNKTVSAPYSFTELLVRAWQNDSSIAVVFLDYPIDGNPGAGATIAPSGMAANWSVSLTKSEDLRDVQRASVTLSVADRAMWYTHPTITGS